MLWKRHLRDGKLLYVHIGKVKKDDVCLFSSIKRKMRIDLSVAEEKAYISSMKRKKGGRKEGKGEEGLSAFLKRTAVVT